jgi:glycerol-3-phosphate acyltransferase PlsY
MGLLLLLVVAYLLGAVPFGVLVARMCRVDIQKLGSGNTGATNVFRVLGPGPGLLVFALDFLKGVLACAMMQWLYPNAYAAITLSATFVLVGHSYSIFLHGKGGKSAATGLGILAFISWPIAVALAVIAAVIIKVTRLMSVATLTVATLVPILFLMTQQPLPYVVLGTFAMGLIWIRHIPNVKRLLAGEEHSI